MAEKKGITAPQEIDDGENDAVPQATESSSDDDDGRRPAKSSSLKRPRVFKEISVNNNIGDENSSTKMADRTRSSKKFPGAHRRKSGRWSAEIKDPFNNRRIWLGTFDSPEEASNVYTAKRLEFREQMKEAQSAMNPSSRLESEFGRSEEQIHTGKNTAKRLEFGVPKDAQSAINPSSRTESESARSEELIDTGKNTAKRLECDWNTNPSSRPESESERSEEQVDTEKNLEPILIDSNEFLLSEFSFNKFDAGMNSENIDAGKNSEPILIESNNEFLLAEFRNLDNDLTSLNKFPGAYQRKSGRWWAEIRDPFMKRKIQLGTFDTPQEASNAYAAKRLEFRKRKEAQFAMNPSRPESEFSRSDEKIDAGKNSEPILIESNEFLLSEFRLNKFPGAHRRPSGKWSTEIRDPFSNRRIWLGTFDTPQEASNVYTAKRLEFRERKEAQFAMNPSRPESEFIIESERSEEQIDAGKNSEPILIERNKLLLGEFRNLDNDLTALNKFPGAYQQKSPRWWAEIRDPFIKHQIRLGTFDTPEEASIAYAAKKLEFRQRKEAKSAMNPSRPESEFESSEEQIDAGKNTEPILIDSNNEFWLGEFRNLDKGITSLNKFPEAYQRKSGRWWAEIRDPFIERQIRLGTFDKPQEASNAYAAKKLEFRRRKEAQFATNPREPERSEEQIDAGKYTEPILIDSNNEFWLGDFRNLDKGITSLNKFPGAYQRKSGRWSASIRDPFMKLQIRLGMFDTPQEASNAYAAKKLEFRKRKEAESYLPESDEPERSEELIDAGKYTEPILIDSNNEFWLGDFRNLDKGITSLNKFPGAYQRKSGRWSASIRDPFMKRQIRLGTFDTPQEASNAYAAKKLEFRKRKEAESYLPESDSSGSGEQIEAGQNWEQILIDSNGFLLGEFSNLDDDLRIS